ncbi:aspartate aminotransferase family protein (plasmid) [Streptomyces lunaelactis]|uniref:Aspartate aminotransferase family protein n=1 Tax=Streptomyces lunaelactis TaxID=1535768 RepID=A0A2R4TFQ3_9ACTN|nr:aminotransferase class V-fold PLP-dependent enzyme [Streptomyces lunaelactis]AVZ77939.1 aspartate aminotransferase family protein [Streptomyces lunaelactis]NUK83400.1 aspartate aminotransferase family protein [Streptomyces lunaelactis]
MDLSYWLAEAVASNADWANTFGPYPEHPALAVDDARFGQAFADFTERLKDNYPFFHPRYAGQMLKPPHPAAVVGYLSAMLINPNNHALDGGPATAQMEREAVQQLATMFGYDTHLGHLTTSGTIANLEALFVARELHPGKGVAYSTEAHYTHGRMCKVLGVEGHPVPVDDRGRMDLDSLEALLRTGRIGTVVLTAGTTALGAVEPIDEALALRERYGVRIHVDAAYGGFFVLLADAPGPEGLPLAPWKAIAECDSIVVDPHKHGLQPYGCGAVLFRDPAVGRFYLHDSPYTYFTSDELHLGEISLECSRSGAAAAALWLTFKLLPPTWEGLGQALAAGRRAAMRWAELIEESERLDLYQVPELDIVTYFPVTEPLTLSTIDEASTQILRAGMTDTADPVFLSTLRVGADRLTANHPKIGADADGARILRSVLMKPQSEEYVPHLHARLEQLAGGAPGAGASPHRGA